MISVRYIVSETNTPGNRGVWALRSVPYPQSYCDIFTFPPTCSTCSGALVESNHA